MRCTVYKKMNTQRTGSICLKLPWLHEFFKQSYKAENLHTSNTFRTLSTIFDLFYVQKIFYIHYLFYDILLNLAHVFIVLMVRGSGPISAFSSKCLCEL